MKRLTKIYIPLLLIILSYGLWAQEQKNDGEKGWVPLKHETRPLISGDTSLEEQGHVPFDTRMDVHSTSDTLGVEDSINSMEERTAFLDTFLSRDSLMEGFLPTPIEDTISMDSTELLLQDSILKDSTYAPDSVKRKKKSGALTDPVTYTATDSMTFEGGNIATMFGEAQVNYQDIQLNAELISMNLDSSEVSAQGSPFKNDTTENKPLGQPKFKDNSGEYTSESMKYNFKTKKGYITNVFTKQGEGYVSGGITKKMANDDMYMQNGRYTTCDKQDHPHFFFRLSKARVQKGKNIVTGPAYLIMEDVTLPVAIPFGFFPFSKSYTSGLLFPSFGQESKRGYYLRNGGYYFAINDYVDLALTGEVYTNGSWGFNVLSYYTKRYKYNGNFNLNYLVTIMGEKGMDDYSKSTDFKVHWTHTQDSKASLNSSFSASVDYSTSSYNHKQIDSYYNPAVSSQNTKSSSINYSYRFLAIPLSLSASITINQRSSDSTISATLPSLNISLSRVYPFKRRKQIGAERWYEKISLSYSGQVRNTITTKENKFLNSSLSKDWKNGMQHSIPISATFQFLKNFTLTPSFNYTERWYKEKIMRDWDPLASKEVADTVRGFYRVYNYSMSLSLSTKLYGFFKPWKMFGTKVQMIRHVFTPSISFSYTPDFGESRYGFWQSYSYLNSSGKDVKVDYSPYSNGIFGTAPRGKSGVINFSFQNNVEMKLRPKENESEEEEQNNNQEDKNKISLIDNLSIGFSYNMAADSMNWSNINTSLRLKLSKSITTNISATFDTYTYDLNESGNPVRVNKLRLKRYGSFGRLSSASTSFSYSLNNDTFKKKDKDKDKKKEDTEDEDDDVEELDSLVEAQRQTLLGVEQKEKKQKPIKSGEVDEDGYHKLDIRWNLSLSYSLSCGYSTFNKEKLEYNRRLNHTLSFSGGLALTKNWKFTFSSSWDFEHNKLAMMTCNLSRNLHCWTLTGSFVPIGLYQSYYFTIALNSSMLRDLKWDKRSTTYEVLNWY